MTFLAPGKVAVAAAGTPVRLSTTDGNYSQITIQYPTGGGTGNVYVGDSKLNKSTGVGVAALLGANQAYTITAGPNGILNPTTIYIDGDTNGNFVYWSGVIR